MALRRKRTINPKYLSEDFESVFTSGKKDVIEDSFVLMDDAAVVMDDAGDVVSSGEQFVTQVI